MDLLHQTSPQLASLPHRRKLGWASGHPVLKAGSNNALGGVGERCEEVGSGLAVRAGEAHFDEVVLGEFRRPEVNLSALIQNRDLIKHLRRVSVTILRTGFQKQILTSYAGCEA